MNTPLLTHGTEWSSCLNVASLAVNGSVFRPNAEAMLDGLHPAEVASMICMVLPILTLMVGMVCLGPQTFAIPPRFLLRFRALTTVWCIAFVLAAIVGNLFLLLFKFLIYDVYAVMRCVFKPRKHAPWLHVLFGFILCALITTACAADAENSGSSLPPMFKATKVHYPVWFMAWCGWVALKYPELVDIIQGEEEEPDEPGADANQELTDVYNNYWKRNKRIYGAVLLAVPSSIKTTLNANARFNGVQALELIRARFP